MTFNSTLFKELLTLIETRVKFTRDGLIEAQCLDFECNIDAEELLKSMNKTNERYKMDEFKYCLAVLKHLDYIKISSGSINGITPSGLKFIMSQLHGIEFKF